ncbi:isochorismate synthase [Galbibacter sp.]|jgi:isochorismate synthase|uniref:isochorismate synthase n=1 Tax=Galbibacter sp. TaxID=2918471 RepID=UPI003A8D164C
MTLSGNVFFQEASDHYDRELPFVVYKYPNQSHIHGLLQSSDQLHKLDHMEQEGFVMVPFIGKAEAVIIPKATSKELLCELSSVQNGPTTAALQLEYLDKQEHMALVNKGIKAIKNGSFQKVVLSREQHIALPDLDCIGLYKNLVLRYPHAFCYLWYHPKVGLWMGASPETLIEVDNQNVNTMALAATVGDIGQTEIHWGVKEEQEQALVTVAILDALKDYCSDIKVSEVQTVKAANLYHLQTKLTARLSGDLGGLVDKLHPTPAVCGLPKLAASDFILENEYYNRSYYTGYLGTLNMEQQAKLYVNLRCMQYLKQQLVLYVGGGITIDSVPELEWEETVNKGKTILNVVTGTL